MPQMSDLARHGRHTTQCPQHTPNLDNALRAKIASHLRSGLPTGVVYRFISFHYFFTLRRLSIPPLRPPPLSLRVFLCTALGRCFCFICCFLFFFYCCFTAENPKLTKKTHRKVYFSQRMFVQERFLFFHNPVRHSGPNGNGMNSMRRLGEHTGAKQSYAARRVCKRFLC